MTKDKAMIATCDDDLNEFEDKSQGSEDESSHEVKAFIAFTKGVPDVFQSDDEKDC